MFLSAGVLWFLLTVCGCGTDQRRPDKFLIPNGYSGWVIVEHQVKGAAPIPVKGGYNVYTVPPGGRLKTSTAMADGWADDEYDYVTPKGSIRLADDGPGEMVWAAKSTYGALPEEGIPLIEVAFIGTKSQYDKADAGPSPKSEEQEARDKAFDAQDKAGKPFKKTTNH